MERFKQKSLEFFPGAGKGRSFYPTTNLHILQPVKREKEKIQAEKQR